MGPSTSRRRHQAALSINHDSPSARLGGLHVRMIVDVTWDGLGEETRISLRSTNVGVVPGLVSHRLIFVTGKGGVGKSTVSAALATASAKSGLRTVLVEIAARRRMRAAFAPEARDLEEVELAPRLFATSIDPQLAMDQYLRIRLGPLGHALGSTKAFQALSVATPGMREMQTMAKIWELAHPDRPAGEGRPYDVVVVDAPATGHAVGLFRTPRTFAGIAGVGPVAKGARLIAAMLADSAFTGFVAVTTAEEIAVNETLLLGDTLEADGLSLSAVVLNRLHPDRFTPLEAAELEACIAEVPAAALGAVRAAVFEHRRARLQSDQVERIGAHVSAPLVALPLLYLEKFDDAAIDTLAEALADAWPASAVTPSLGTAG